MKIRLTEGMRCFDSKQRRRMRNSLIKQYGPYCQICKEKGKPLNIQSINLQSVNEDDSFSFDHIIALADGGLNKIENMQPAHRLCNTLKGSIKGGSRVASRKPRKSNNVPRLAYSSTSSKF